MRSSVSSRVAGTAALHLATASAFARILALLTLGSTPLGCAAMGGGVDGDGSGDNADIPRVNYDPNHPAFHTPKATTLSTPAEDAPVPASEVAAGADSGFCPGYFEGFVPILFADEQPEARDPQTQEILHTTEYACSRLLSRECWEDVECAEDRTTCTGSISGTVGQARVGSSNRVQKARATWRIPLPEDETYDGLYALDVWIPHTQENADDDRFTEVAEYTVNAADGEVTAKISHRNPLAGQFVRLGGFRLEAGQEVVIDLKPNAESLGEAAGLLVVDNIRLVKLQLNLTNAAWLAYFASNEYSHFAAMGPLLEQLGFGEPGEGTSWTHCAFDDDKLEEYEANGRLVTPERSFDELSEIALDAWGPCSRGWYEQEILETGASRPTEIATAFNEWLVQEVFPDAKIQFFSAGDAVADDEGRIVFESGSTQVFYAEHRTLPYAIVSFRGTEPSQIQDILADAKFKQVPLVGPDDVEWPDGWGHAHRGFLAAFNEVEPQLVEKIKGLEGTGKTLWLTGHSLGGALATMFAARVLNEKEKGLDVELAGVYTFGAPRVGDYYFRDRFNELAYKYGVSAARFRHSNDAVAHSPPRGLLTFLIGAVETPFDHADNLVHLESGDFGNLLVEPPNAFEEDRLFELFSDHAMGTYYQQVLRHSRDPDLAYLNRCDSRGFGEEE